jgi:hypothetical protein
VNGNKSTESHSFRSEPCQPKRVCAEDFLDRLNFVVMARIPCVELIGKFVITRLQKRIRAFAVIPLVGIAITDFGLVYDEDGNLQDQNQVSGSACISKHSSLT